MWTAFSQTAQYENWKDAGYHYFQVTVKGSFANPLHGGYGGEDFSVLTPGLNSSIGAHELAHCLTLEDWYDKPLDSMEAIDQANLMHVGKGTALRYVQRRKANGGALGINNEN